MTAPPPDLSLLPAGWSWRTPEAVDVPRLVELADAHERSVHGRASTDPDAVAATVTGTASWTRRQVVLTDPEGTIRAWASVHDRAAGRTMVQLEVDPDGSHADEAARTLLRWMEGAARDVAALRELEETQLDALFLAGDERQARWFAEAGYRHTRTWLNMTRPVDDAPELPGPRAGVRIRRVSKHDDGLPVAADLQIVHQMLEESFADHFNSYRESFPEFVQRLREDPGHRWDHWWIAEVTGDDGEELPGGALVASVMRPDSEGREGSYVEYIGVHRRSRGRGVAKALLHTVIRDAHDRERNRVDLEVDADSPTGAHELYASMGWTNKYTTESWHADCAVRGVRGAGVGS